MSERAYSQKVVGYVRVSTGEQADSGAGLEAQRQAIESEAARRGWELVHVYEDAGASGKTMNGRAGLAAALQAMEAGQAQGLIVNKLDRLSRSVIDFASLLEFSRKQDWALVAMDVGVDTSTAAGQLVANVMASVAEWERRVIGERTSAALRVKREQGVVVGRPREMCERTVERIQELREVGMNHSEIARQLNEENVPTATGSGQWHPPGVARALTWVRA